MKIKAILFLLAVTAVIFTYSSSNAGTGYSGADSSKVCIVSGETIEGGGVKFKYLDKELTFCCGGCEKSFKKDPAKYMKEGVTDPVCDMKDSKKDINYTHKDVKYYFCNESCKEEFSADPEKYIEKYNKSK